MNVLIVHNYGLFYVYDLFLSQECGHWVKARSTTWNHLFLVIQLIIKDGLNIFELVKPL
jgi:hypothetical protein